jgi:DNA (cytosine-5)-methyltransferase 1
VSGTRVNVLDLFSGIGGFSLGLERSGMRTVAFCERDEFCRAVLRKHWPDVPCFDDIRSIDADGLGRLGRIDLVCGGFPCQPFSVAGKQEAQKDDRYLWPAMRQVIALARPDWVIGENVAGIISLALDDVLADLEGLGYAARPFVIPACAVGAHHRRDRVWIIATDAQRAKLQPRRVRGQSGANPAESGHDGPSESMADAASKRRGEARELLERCAQRLAGRSEILAYDAGISGGWCWWPAEPDVGRVAHGVPARVDRLRALGNAVVPQIPEIIGRAILRCSQ